LTSWTKEAAVPRATLRQDLVSKHAENRPLGSSSPHCGHYDRAQRLSQPRQIWTKVPEAWSAVLYTQFTTAARAWFASVIARGRLFSASAPQLDHPTTTI